MLSRKFSFVMENSPQQPWKKSRVGEQRGEGASSFEKSEQKGEGDEGDEGFEESEQKGEGDEGFEESEQKGESDESFEEIGQTGDEKGDAAELPDMIEVKSDSQDGFDLEDCLGQIIDDIVDDNIDHRDIAVDHDSDWTMKLCSELAMVAGAALAKIPESQYSNEIRDELSALVVNAKIMQSYFEHHDPETSPPFRSWTSARRGGDANSWQRSWQGTSSEVARACRHRPICTWRAPISTAAGFSLHC